MRQMFVDLQAFVQSGRFHSGCSAALEAEAHARTVLAAQHHAWMLWVACVGVLAAKVADTSLLLLVCAKRQEMLAGGADALRKEDVYLAIQYAIAIGFGSPEATASLVAAFGMDQSLCGDADNLGEVAFIERWMPAGPLWSPHVRTATGVALGLTVPPPGRVVPSDLQANPRMAVLMEERSAEVKHATLQRATACIGQSEQRRAAARLADRRAAAAATASLPTGSVDSTENATHEYTPTTIQPSELNRVRLIEGAFDDATCASIMSAVDAAAERRGGWDKDRHGKYPTTDMPIRAIGELEGHIRTLLFERVLRPLAPLYLPEPCLPEHLEFIDLFFVRYSTAEGQQRELELHTDDSTFSFNILLNSPDAFAGGGTYFEATKRTVRAAARGTAVVHSGHARHGGVAITSGERYLLVGFVGSVRYPYTVRCKGWAEHAAANAFAKFGAGAWDRSPLKTTVAESVA